jgi:SAM-dependent methyltransferase
MLRSKSRQHKRGGDWSRLDLPAGKLIVLNVGCGPPRPENLDPYFHRPEWHEVRLDIDPAVKPDIVGTIVDMSGVPGGAVDGIWSEHNLEHVFAHEVGTVLREFLRVLRPGGIAMLSVPDLQRIAKHLSSGDVERPFYESDAGPIGVLDVLYGHGASIAQGNEYMAHRTGFTAKSLGAHLREAGFVGVNVQRVEIALLEASGRKPG